MVVVRPEHVDEMPGDPPIYPVGCAGVITESHRLPDGRYNLVLLGEHRVRVVARGAARRVAPVSRRARRAARGLVSRTPSARAWRGCAPRSPRTSASWSARAQPDRSHAFDPELFAGVDDETFVNAVANAFAFPAEEKQALLEAETCPSATRASRARSRSSGSSSRARAEAVATCTDRDLSNICEHSLEKRRMSAKFRDRSRRSPAPPRAASNSRPFLRTRAKCAESVRVRAPQPAFSPTE